MWEHEYLFSYKGITSLMQKKTDNKKLNRFVVDMCERIFFSGQTKCFYILEMLYK